MLSSGVQGSGDWGDKSIFYYIGFLLGEETRQRGVVTGQCASPRGMRVQGKLTPPSNFSLKKITNGLK